MVEEEPNDNLQPKWMKKQSLKQERKELIKQQIFNDYYKIMTYKIHKNEKESTDKNEWQNGRKTWSIMQNIAITINPSKESP